MAQDSFIHKSSETNLPVLVSVPHCGTQFPDFLKHHFDPKIISNPEDTDWEVQNLYQPVVDEFSFSLIFAKYSRYVVDLNRDRNDTPLYSDGRSITSVTPTNTFSGKALYQRGYSPSDTLERRLVNYYDPYHHQLASSLAALKSKHGIAILIEAHSIKRHVPSINPNPFPDIILGDNQGKSCCQSLTNNVARSLEMGPFETSRNQPFKGGFITRSFGKPDENIHAFQLEMSQDIYLDESTLKVDENSAQKVRKQISAIFSTIKDYLNQR